MILDQMKEIIIRMVLILRLQLFVELNMLNLTNTIHQQTTLKFLTKNGLYKSYIVMVKIINKISNLILPECKVLCEPQLGKRGLHPLLGTKEKNGGKKVYKFFTIFKWHK